MARNIAELVRLLDDHQNLLSQISADLNQHIMDSDPGALAFYKGFVLSIAQYEQNLLQANKFINGWLALYEDLSRIAEDFAAFFKAEYAARLEEKEVTAGCHTRETILDTLDEGQEGLLALATFFSQEQLDDASSSTESEPNDEVLSVVCSRFVELHQNLSGEYERFRPNRSGGYIIQGEDEETEQVVSQQNIPKRSSDCLQNFEEALKQCQTFITEQLQPKLNVKDFAAIKSSYVAKLELVRRSDKYKSMENKNNLAPAPTRQQKKSYTPSSRTLGTRCDDAEFRYVSAPIFGKDKRLLGTYCVKVIAAHNADDSSAHSTSIRAKP